MNQLQVFSYNNSPVEFELIDGKVYANATAMFKANSGRIDHWKDSANTQRYIQAVSQNLGIAENQLIIIRKGGLELQGTWIHERLIVNAARYISVDFELWCDERISEIIRQSALPAVVEQTPLSRKQLAMMVIESEERIEALEREVAEGNQIIGQQQRKVEYVNQVLSADNCWTVTTVAKDLNMSATALNDLLCKIRIQYKVDDHYVLFAKYHDKGYTKTRTNPYRVDGAQKSSILMVWTELGRAFIHHMVKKYREQQAAIEAQNTNDLTD